MTDEKLTAEGYLAKTKRIYDVAVRRYKPHAIVAMISGGNDSAAAYYSMKALGCHIDYIMHIKTNCGIRQTSEFVIETYSKEAPEFILADAGNAYERYVKRKGFFGRGFQAHEHAYHVLKAGPMRKALSKHIRKGRRGIRILLLNGARLSESENRKHNLNSIINKDPSQKKNIWVNVIHHWSDDQKENFLESVQAPINPVTKAMCRSGECMCGTMQSMADRAEASILYPEWGKWLNDLEAAVLRAFPWRWGQATDKALIKQRDLFYEDGQFMPMCVGCGGRENG